MAFRLKRWHKIALGVGGVAVVGGALYSAGEKKGAKKKKKKTKEPDVVVSPPPGAPIPTPDAPIPEPPASEQEASSVSRELVDEKVFATSDNVDMPLPVTGRVWKNDSEFTVDFEHAGGMTNFKHATLEAAKLRLDSMVNKPSGWTCTAKYDSKFDAWVCTAGNVAGDTIVRGFFDTPTGPAPWFVVWDGDKVHLLKMASMGAPVQDVGQYDMVIHAMEAAVA